MRGEESDFFPLGDAFQEKFDLVGDAVGMDGKADKNEVVFIELRAFIDLLDLFVTLQSFVNRLCDLLGVSCDAVVSNERFQCPCFQAKI